jgi:diguanylate cyclase (GGDEF)-like protein
VRYPRIDDPAKLQALLAAVLLTVSDLDLDALLRSIVEEAVALTGARYAALGVRHPTQPRLVQFIHAGIPDRVVEDIGHLPEGKGILGLLIDQPEPLRLAHLSEHPASVGFPPSHPPMTTFLGVPVRTRDVVFGNLYLTNKAGGVEFDEMDQDAIETLAYAAGIAIENARLHAEIADAALHDKLTGLPNRAALMDFIHQALARLERRPGLVALLFIDLDGFKLVNDTMGHDAGDEVLSFAAQRIQDSIRAIDSCARLGGDEFIVLGEFLSAGEADTFAERLSSVLAQPYTLTTGETATIGASVGVAETDDPDESPEELIRRGDQLMYEKKELHHAGR